MKKGRPMTRGLDDAVAIARKRGCVMKCEYGLENTCDLFIRTSTYIALVRLRRMDKIDAPVGEIEHESRDLIAELRLFPESAQIHLELWAYSRHGTYRLFLIRGTGLVELGRDGEPAGEKENGALPPGPDTGAGEGKPDLADEGVPPSETGTEKTCSPPPP